MKVKTFVSLQLFELGYLGLLAVLPFLVAIPIVGGTILLGMAYLGAKALYRKFMFRSVPLEDKAVLITGCDSGFGFALTKRLSAAGLTVFAACHRVDSDGALELKNIGSENIHILQIDVTSEQSVAEAFKTVKNKLKSNGLWCLVNNAGISTVADVEFCSMETYENITNVNLFGMIRVTKAFLPLVRTEKGRIVNVTSADTCYHGHSAHAMTKAGCGAFTTSLRRELSKFGVVVITVEPGNFYGATGILNKNALVSLEKDMEKQWKEAGNDLREVYGKDYLQQQHKITTQFASTTCNTLGPVVDTLEDAIVSTKPNLRYLVDGSNLPLDIHNILVRLQAFLPESLVDMFYERELSPTIIHTNSS